MFCLSLRCTIIKTRIIFDPLTCLSYLRADLYHNKTDVVLSMWSMMLHSHKIILQQVQYYLFCLRAFVCLFIQCGCFCIIIIIIYDFHHIRFFLSHDILFFCFKIGPKNSHKSCALHSFQVYGFVRKVKMFYGIWSKESVNLPADIYLYAYVCLIWRCPVT